MSLKILSYNICWECMDNQSVATHCNNDSCLHSVKSILSKSFDFIGLQEATPKIISNLNYNHIKFSSKIKNNISVYALLLYNNSKFSVINNSKISGILKDNNRLNSGRLFVGAIFKNIHSNKKYLVVSLHNGHDNTLCNWVHLINNQIKRKNNIYSKHTLSGIIIMGDFNENVNKCSSINLLDFNITPINTNTNTCCNFNSNSYRYVYDNIITNLPLKTFNTITPKNFASDHLPITATLYNSISGGSKSKSYNYKQKYLKYKQKYLKLKNHLEITTSA